MRTFARDVAERFSENIVRRRLDANLSQEALGLRASLHRTEISLLERGTRMPQLDTVLKVAGGLGVSPCDLLDGMAWNPGFYTPGDFNVPRTHVSGREDEAGR